MTAVLRRSTLRPKSRARHAGQLLEFMLVLPLALFLLVFAIDMGRLVLASTALTDAATVGARAGARIGYAGGGYGDCTGPARGGESPSYDATCQSLRVLAGAKVTWVAVMEPAGGWCTNGAPWVRVEVRAEMSYIAPGLGQLIGAFTGDGQELISTGIARCEVTR